MKPTASREEILSTIQEAGIDPSNVKLHNGGSIAFQNPDDFAALYRHLGEVPYMFDKKEGDRSKVFCQHQGWTYSGNLEGEDLEAARAAKRGSEARSFNSPSAHNFEDNPVQTSGSLTELIQAAEKSGFTVGPVRQVQNRGETGGIALYLGDELKQEPDAVIISAGDIRGVEYRLYHKKDIVE